MILDVSRAIQDVKIHGAYIDDDEDDDDMELMEDFVGTILQASESTASVIVALNSNTALKFFRIYIYDVAGREWRALPLCSEAALGVIPSRLTVCAALLHANILFMLLAHDLPYPSDLQRVNILAFDVGRGRLALLTFHQRRNRRGGNMVATHLQTAMTDVRSVPPVLVHCAGCLCVVGNVDAVGSIFVCDLASSVYTCYTVPGVRFVSLARATVGDDRYVYIWCRHRFGLEAYCVNREVAFTAFDIRRRTFVSPLPPPPGIGYDDFATAAHVLCTNSEGQPVIHSPGRRSFYLDLTKRLWIPCADSMPAPVDHRAPAEMPYRGCELYSCLEVSDSNVGGVYAVSNAAPFITSLLHFGAGNATALKLRPPPIDGITVMTAGQLCTSFCAALPVVERFDDSFARLIHKKSRQLYDVDKEDNTMSERQSPDTDSSDSGSDVEDGLEYDDDIYGYFDDYEYERSVNLL